MINLKSLKKVRASKYYMDDSDTEDLSDVGKPESRNRTKKNKCCNQSFIYHHQQHTQKTELEVEVNLRPTVGQSVLVSGAHPGPVANFPFPMKFPVDSSYVCPFI
jgi:hypothetical protein